MRTIEEPPELDPDTDRVLKATRWLHDADRTEEAITVCQWVLEREPDNPIAWNNLGSGHGRTGRIRKALECYRRAIVLWPGYPEAWNNMGTVLGDLGRLEAFLVCATRAVDLGPRGWLRLYNKASALAGLGRYEEALHCHHQLRFLELDSESVRAHHRETLRDYGAWLSYLRDAEKEVVANPQDSEAWDRKGEVLASLARLEESVHCYDRGLVLDPASDRTWSGKGVTLRRMRRMKDAIESLDRAIELSRGSDGGEHFGAWHQKGYCLASLGEAAAAIDCHARTLELHPIHLTAWFDKALLEDRLGRIADARESFQRFAEQSSWLYIGQREWAQERLAEMEEELA